MKYRQLYSIIMLLLLATPVFSASIIYKYDHLDRLSEVTLENGQKITYAYDKIGNLRSKTPSVNVATITASAVTGGQIFPNGAITFTTGSNKNYSITPSDGYVIDNVSVDGVPQGAISSYKFSNIIVNHTITASFAKTYNLTTSVSTGGTVTSTPAGMSCGNNCSSFLAGTLITLTATPDANSTFAGWSGVCTGTAPCQLTMNDNKAVTATFNIIPPVAAFSSSSTAGGTPLIATMTDQSQRATSWSWNFGDGATSTAQNPTHVYQTPGTYTITLTVANESGSASAPSRTITITACQNQPVRIPETGVFYPSLAAALVAATDGQTIQLQAWNFLEGATITKSVTLDGGYDCTFTNKLGWSVLEGELRISGGSVRMKDVRIAGAALAAMPAITVAPSADSFGSVIVNTNSAAHPFTIGNNGGANLTIGSIGISGAHSGEFVITADSCSGRALTPSTTCVVQVVFAPTATGARSAALTVSSNDSATPTTSVPLNGIGILPVISVAKSGTGTGLVASYLAGISCGNGCTGSFMTGTQVTLTATPDADSIFGGWSGGCVGTGACTVAMAADFAVTASFNKLPAVAGFNMSATSGGAPLLVNFTDASQFATSWLWNFGDGATSSEQNPGHVYKSPGTYNTTLTATNVSGSTTLSQTIAVTPCGALPVRIGAAYYPTLQAAYDVATDSATIQALAFDFAENLAINRAISVILEGGYMCGFGAGSPGMTSINGEPHVMGGSVRLRNIRVK